MTTFPSAAASACTLLKDQLMSSVVTSNQQISTLDATAADR
jgi:hypothetical protein